MQHRIRAHFRQHSKSFRFDANNTTLRLQSCSRSGSQQSGEGEFHLQLAADRQSVGGNNKSSGDTAVPRLAFAVMNTIIFSLPGESHICRQSISVVLPLIHRIPVAAQPLSDKSTVGIGVPQDSQSAVSNFTARAFLAPLRWVSG